MKIARRACFPAAALSLVLLSAVAGAQQPAMDPAVKERVDKLYKEAVGALDAKDFATACPKLEEVTRIAPEGIGVRITLGECYEGAGKLASAWSQYVAAEAMATNAGQDARVKKAAAKAAAVKPKLATLTIEVPAAVKQMKGLVIAKDGAPMLDAQWGTPLPIDKGEHRVVVSAPEHESRTVAVSIAEDGTATTLKIEPLALEKAPNGPLPSASATASSAPVVVAPANGGRSKVPSFVLWSVGVVSVAVGGALVGVAGGVYGDIDAKLPKDASGRSLCLRNAQAGEDAKCPDLRAEADSGSAMGNAGIGLLVGGGVLVAAATVYFLIPSKRADARSSRLVPVVSQQGAGLVWNGSF